MTPDQFRKHVVSPVLAKMDMWSMDAENLLVGTAIHESDGMRRITQYNGPALSYYQIEPDTLDDLYNNFLVYRPEMKELLDDFKIPSLSNNYNLMMNAAYATAAARLQYYRVKEAIPKSLEGQAAYWKKYWNTEKGAGTDQQYIDHNIEYYI